jgi:hypothetical protein
MWTASIINLYVNVHIAAASSVAKLLRLREDHVNSTPFRREMCRRLLCTLLIMDRTLSPSLNIPCNFRPEETINEPLPDNHLQNLASGIPVHGYSGNLILEILDLSEIFRRVCVYHRERGNDDEWRTLYNEQDAWQARLPEDLIWTPTNFAFHQKNQSLRKFLYIHLLHNHICQLIYFPFLQGSAAFSTNTFLGAEQISQCHYHAKLITGESPCDTTSGACILALPPCWVNAICRSFLSSR